MKLINAIFWSVVFGVVVSMCLVGFVAIVPYVANKMGGSA